MDNKKELETTDKNEIMPAISDDNIIAVAAKAEERINAINKIKRISLRVTNHHDWVDQNSRPYLQASGSEKVARLFGISWRIDEPTMDLEKDGHFAYTYKGYFSISGTTIEAIGTRSSKDPFFKKYSYSTGKKIELPVSEIDKTNVKKAAYTNLIGNGITRLLGIRNLTYDDLKEAGINITKITKVEYKLKGKPQSQGSQVGTQGAPAMKDPDAPATEPQQKAIHAMLGKLDNKDEYTKHTEVSNILQLKDIITSMGDISKKQASTVIEHLQAELDKQK